MAITMSMAISFCSVYLSVVADFTMFLLICFCVFCGLWIYNALFLLRLCCKLNWSLQQWQQQRLTLPGDKSI